MQTILPFATLVMTVIGSGLMVLGFFGGYARSKRYAFLVGEVAIINVIGYSLQAGMGILLGFTVPTLFIQAIIASVYFDIAARKAS